MLKASAFLNHHHHYCCCNDDDVDDFNNGERSSKINITRVPPVPTEKTTTTRLGPHLGGHAHAVIQVNVRRSAFASFGGSYSAMAVGGAERVPNKTLSSSSNVLAIFMHVGLSIRGCYFCCHSRRDYGRGHSVDSLGILFLSTTEHVLRLSSIPPSLLKLQRLLLLPVRT